MSKEKENAEQEIKEEIKEEKKPKKASAKKAAEPSEAEKLKKELDEKNDQYMRLCAEYDNFRKRSQKEKQDIAQLERCDIVKKLLPIADNFERALGSDEGEKDDFRKGVELIYTQLLDTFKKIGIEPYCEVGDTFDPTLHNAVMTCEDENLGENTVAQVFSKGYKLGDRVVREAVVQVANT